MAIRVLHYVSSLYMDFIRSSQKFEKLPAIFPIVLYNGDRKWTAAVNVNELIDQQPSLEPEYSNRLLPSLSSRIDRRRHVAPM